MIALWGCSPNVFIPVIVFVIISFPKVDEKNHQYWSRVGSGKAERAALGSLPPPPGFHLKNQLSFFNCEKNWSTFTKARHIWTRLTCRPWRWMHLILSLYSRLKRTLRTFACRQVKSIVAVRNDLKTSHLWNCEPEQRSAQAPDSPSSLLFLSFWPHTG